MTARGPDPSRHFLTAHPGHVTSRVASRPACLTCRLDIDHAAVARRMQGDHTVPLTAAERAVAIDRLDAGGAYAWQVAEWLGYSQRTVERRQKRRRAPGDIYAGLGSRDEHSSTAQLGRAS